MKDILEAYCSQNSTQEPAHLQELKRITWLNTINPRMLTGHLQGRLLALLSHIVAPKLVIEIGTFTGYGALCLAEGLSKGGKVHSVEINPENAFKAQAFIKTTDYAQSIQVHVQSGLDFLQAQNELADIIYVDGEKRSYKDYISLCAIKLRVGGLLIFDNTLWAGKVIDSNKDTDTQIMIDFNAALAAHKSFETVLLPMRDGLTIARRLQ
jgi:caffeoyl-CoA O-methyltransferase